MSYTVQNIIDAALRKLGVYGAGEVTSANDTSDCLQALNFMLDAWGDESLMLQGEVEENFPLVAATQAYTIGANQTFDTAKPNAIGSAYYQDSQNLKYPLDIYTLEEFQSFEDSQIMNAPPKGLYYDPGVPQQANQTGTIFLYPTPDQAYTLYLSSVKPLSEFANANSTVTFRPSYYRALVYNLAIEIAPEYGKKLTPEIVKIARESKDNIAAVNAMLQIVGLDLPTTKAGGFNWISGDLN